MQKDTSQRKTKTISLAPHSHTEDIIALKAKRLNETGKVYFLESTYTQITVTFLAQLAAHIHTVYCSEKDFLDTYQGCDTNERTINAKRKITGRNEINQRIEKIGHVFLAAFKSNFYFFLSSSPSYPPSPG